MEAHPNEDVRRPTQQALAFILPDTNGQLHALETADSPLILVFYRGDW